MSDIILQLSEDFIEIENNMSLEMKRTELNQQPVVNLEEKCKLDMLLHDLYEKRNLIERFQQLIESMTRDILELANHLFRPKFFETNLNDTFTSEVISYLKIHSDFYFFSRI